MQVEHRWQAIRQKLEAAADDLSRQGTLASRLASGRRVWSVRFYEQQSDGRRHQRAIYLGSNPELVNRAEELLAEYRQRQEWCEQAELFAKISRSLCRAVARGRKSISCMASGAEGGPIENGAEN
jgi:hypothetical protein